MILLLQVRKKCQSVQLLNLQDFNVNKRTQMEMVPSLVKIYLVDDF